MSPRESLTDTLPRRELPTEIYAPIVASLFGDRRSLFIGAFAAIMSTLVIAWKTAQPVILFCSLAIIAITFARAWQMAAFARARRNPMSRPEIRRWELQYIAGAALYTLILSLNCTFTFLVTDDPFSQLLSFSIALAYLIGTPGRNFASDTLVHASIVCACLPLMVALAIAGGPYYTVFAFVLVPFFISLKFISARLRRQLLDAIIAANDVSLLAKRFDTALNNMPHGLAMFDAAGRLVVANEQMSNLLRLPSTAMQRGAEVRELISSVVAAGTITATDGERIARQLDERAASGTRGDLEVVVNDGRTLDLTFQDMENGGAVVLLQDVTERRDAEARINQLARYDALTGLPNRNMLRSRMETVLAGDREGRCLAVLFIDLDHFKQVNDTLGHRYGDQLLCAVADRLRRTVRESDTVARFGGDEFIAFMAVGNGAHEAEELAARIVSRLAEPYELEGHEVVIGASIGIAVTSDGKADADQLLRDADTALYQAKSDGRGGWRFFESEMAVKAQTRRHLEMELRAALANEAFEVYYQPIYNLKQDRFTTCEALLRWPHPQRGMISPAEFIPIAEEMGLIVEIGAWVLKRATAECMRWPGHMRVAVNLSPAQFRRGNVVTAVEEALAASGLPAERLELEITESVLLQDVNATRVALQQLCDLGVRISLDDFGTGYSSLSYLQRFRLHKVKIDRSFLRGIGTTEQPLILLRGVARLSAELGMTVVVEGIETREQLALVARQGTIDEIQGFLLSKPVPARELRPLLAADIKLSERVA